MKTPLRVLIIEDSEDDTLLLARELRRGGYDPAYEQVDTSEALDAALDSRRWDAVIADYALPRFDGLAALRVVRERGLDVPFIIVSGQIGEDLAVAAMKAGANDYVMKGNLTRLSPALTRELREAEVRREHQRAETARMVIEARFARLLDIAADAIIVINDARKIVIFNKRAEQIFGYTANEALDQPLNLLLPSYLSKGRDLVADFIANDETGTGTGARYDGFIGRRKDGATFPVEASIARLVQDSETTYTIILQDVTERTQAQKRIRRQIEHLRALRAIDSAITASLDLRLSLDVVLNHVLNQLGVDAAATLLLDPQSHTLIYAAGCGFYTAAITRSRVRLGDGHAGKAALERRTLAVPNLHEAATQSVRAALLVDEGFVSYYGVPLITKGQIHGVLEIFHRTPLTPDAEWVEFLETLAGQAAIAIDNVRLFDALQRSNLDLALAYDTTLEGWSRALDLRDHETEGHTLRVTEMALRLAHVMGLEDSQLVHVRRGALLHDIGKMGIPDQILLKPGRLTDDEWQIMRLHPVYAYEWLAPITFLRPALDIPYCHHEKWDGSGYPRGLSGEKIPLAARIFSVADVWDALRSDRPYRKGWSDEQVRKHIRGLMNQDFDPQVVEIFLDVTGQARILGQ